MVEHFLGKEEVGSPILLEGSLSQHGFLGKEEDGSGSRTIRFCLKAHFIRVFLNQKHLISKHSISLNKYIRTTIIDFINHGKREF